MAAVLGVQGEDLKQVASANAELVEVARKLADLAEETSDQTMKLALYEQVRQLLGTSKRISVAVNSVVRPRLGLGGIFS